MFKLNQISASDYTSQWSLFNQRAKLNKVPDQCVRNCLQDNRYHHYYHSDNEDSGQLIWEFPALSSKAAFQVVIWTRESALFQVLKSSAFSGSFKMFRMSSYYCLYTQIDYSKLVSNIQCKETKRNDQEIYSFCCISKGAQFVYARA